MPQTSCTVNNSTSTPLAFQLASSVAAEPGLVGLPVPESVAEAMLHGILVSLPALAAKREG
jgi:hypothetical protein